jgi:outer membrane protein OmpU
MKKVLLGTSALVAASLVAHEASAQNLQAGLAGFIRNWVMFYDHPSGSTARDMAIAQNNEVFFTGTTKLSNGLTFGFRMELEAWSQTAATSHAGQDQFDEVWAFVRGSFGEIRVGEEDDARKLKAYSSYIGGLLGVDSPDAVYSLGTSTTYYNVENDTLKLLYFSPSFSGFSFAVSYAPDAAKGTRGFATQGKNDCDGTQSRGCNGNAFSIAADYRGKLGAGWTTSNNEIAANRDVEAVRADAFVQAMGWEASIQYGKLKNGAGNNLDVQALGGGIKYTTGPWDLGVLYQRGKTEVAAGSNKIAHLAVGAAYNLGSGVQVLGSYNYQKRDFATAADQTASTVVIGLAASF